jgi:hypothetical protein
VQLPDPNLATNWPQNNAHKGMPQTVRTRVYKGKAAGSPQDRTMLYIAQHNHEETNNEGDGGSWGERDGELKQ